MAYTGKDMTQPKDYDITAQYQWASKKLNPTIWNPACMVSPNKCRGATTAYFVIQWVRSTTSKRSASPRYQESL